MANGRIKLILNWIFSISKSIEWKYRPNLGFENSRIIIINYQGLFGFIQTSGKSTVNNLCTNDYLYHILSRYDHHYPIFSCQHFYPYILSPIVISSRGGVQWVTRIFGSMNELLVSAKIEEEKKIGLRYSRWNGQKKM